MRLIQRIRFPRSFSLRTLLIFVTLFCVWLGYEMNWIHQRRAFLTRQFESHLVALPVPAESDRREWGNVWWQGQTITYGAAPGGLWIFGESGIVQLSVVVPESDIV